jgi:hypothetical protein
MSRPVTVTLPHQLGVEEAKRRIEQGFGQLEAQIGGGLGKTTKHWEGDRMRFSTSMLGQAISGRLDVLSDAVRVEIDLPEILAMIANTIKGRVQKQGQLLLEKKSP